jgi:hypothetical protein
VSPAVEISTRDNPCFSEKTSVASSRNKHLNTGLKKKDKRTNNDLQNYKENFRLGNTNPTKKQGLSRVLISTGEYC